MLNLKKKELFDSSGFKQLIWQKCSSVKSITCDFFKNIINQNISCIKRTATTNLNF